MGFFIHLRTAKEVWEEVARTHYDGSYICTFVSRRLSPSDFDSRDVQLVCTMRHQICVARVGSTKADQDGMCKTFEDAAGGDSIGPCVCFPGGP